MIPKFRGHISLEHLNRLVEQVNKLATMNVDGGHLVDDGTGYSLLLGQKPNKVIAKVYYDPPAGSGSGSGSPNSQRRRYRFETVRPTPGGEWETWDLNQTSSTNVDHAYEYNNYRVRDGSVQELEFMYSWRKEDVPTPYLVREWRFRGTAGSFEAIGSGSETGSETGGCQGIKTSDLIVCLGDMLDERCLIEVDGILTLLDSDGNTVATV